ncbi:MAG: ice-binding family protein [bacterium]|nr:ice-binding family protein [bacterium]
MKLNANLIIILLVISFAFGLFRPITALAASTPSLGTASTFGVLSNLFQHNIATTTITGDLGYSSTAGLGPVTVSGTTYVNNAAWTAAGIDQGTAWTNLNNQYLSSCTDISALGPLEGADIDGAGPLPPGTFSPGCYKSSGAMNITDNGIVTLSGAGTYIFRPNGALTTGADSQVNLAGGASACDVFWIPTAATTLGANSIFTGTDIDASGITIGATTTWSGRALAYGGTITADTDTITVPTSQILPLLMLLKRLPMIMEVQQLQATGH